MQVQAKQDFQTRFKFILTRNFNNQDQEICALNFYATPKEFGDIQLSVENSWEIAESFNDITVIFQKYMRGITEDYIDKNKELYEPLDLHNDYSYSFKLIDCEATKRDGNQLVHGEKEEREIYSKTIYGYHFYPVSPLSIIPIWKSNLFENNSKGIRDILKDCLSLQKYSSRFVNAKAVQNTYYLV